MQPEPDQAIDDAALAGAKRTLRKAILFRRDTRSVEQRTRDDEARMAIMIDSLSARMPDTVAAYLSGGSEPGTLQLVAWLAAHDVRVLLPVLSIRRVAGWIGRPGPRTRDPIGCGSACCRSWNRPAIRCRVSSCPRPN